MELRPYQTRRLTRFLNLGKELVAPCGSPNGVVVSKTIVFSKVAEIRAFARRRKKLSSLPTRRKLLTQARDKIYATTGLSCAFEKAGESAIDSFEPITCASVQTLMRESRLRRFSPYHYGTIIVDEAHHALSDSYQNILNYFSSAKVLGVTATPDRGDKKNLGSYFEDVAFEYSIRDAIKEKYLSKISVKTIPLKISLEGVKTTVGDFSADDLGSAIDPYLEEIGKQISRQKKR